MAFELPPPGVAPDAGTGRTDGTRSRTLPSTPQAGCGTTTCGTSYATWLVSDGVPVNIVQTIMGHEQASTTLNRCTHTPDGYEQRVLAAFEASADFRGL